MSDNSYGTSLEHLGELLSSYPALQEYYNSRVHGPDFRAFSDLWEKSLYKPIRCFVAASLADPRASGELLYCAPGGHAPLLQCDDGASLASRFERIGLVDIDPATLAPAAALAHALNPSARVETMVLDFSGRVGQRLCDIYADALRASTTASEVAERLGEASERAQSIFRDASEIVGTMSEQIDASLGRFPDGLCVSEMMASFTATPAFLAFRSELYRMLARTDDRRAVSDALERAARLWQVYNDLFLHFHLRFFRSQLSVGGQVIIVFDTQKIFDDAKLGPIASFSDGFSFSKAFKASRLKARRHAEAVWLDHPVDYEAKVHGIAVNDFKAHRHAIALFALEAVG